MLPASDQLPVALLVDRDRDTRQMYAEFLKQSAYDIEEAEDGREALAKALSRHPDVIVTETRLAGISGFDLCRLLRSDTTTQDIPIVVLTGDVFPADMNRAAAAGADVVLTKPCLPDGLAKAISRLLAQSRDLLERGHALHAQIAVQLKRSHDVLERSHVTVAKRKTLNRLLERRNTTEPPSPPPALRCPGCDGQLKYVRSHVGGVSVKHQEQWDYFECPTCAVSYQFRQRTRRVRRLP